MALKNETDRKVYVFIPRGRADGIRISLPPGQAAELKSLNEEAEPGLVAETEIGAGETVRTSYPLTDWLILRAAGNYRIEAACTFDAYNASLRDKDSSKRIATPVEVKGEVVVTVLPAAS
jgi:hypothetical protein